MQDLSFTFGEFATTVSFADRLDLAALAENALFVFDANTFSLFGGSAPRHVVIPVGEQAKSWESVDAILKALVGIGARRDTTVIAVGGGVVSDVAAFAASVYMRGCALTIVPTTLLAMVDAAFGGKTGFDYAGFKNLIGTFYPAARLLVSAGVLGSLPQREYLSGLAEVIKTAMIGDAEMLAVLRAQSAAVRSRTPELLAEIVRRCLAVKGGVVADDLRERGNRAVLNLGHTFAHALESSTGFSGWSHGEAVAWGLGRALRAGLILGLTDESYARDVMSLLELYGYRLRTDAPAERLLDAMKMDKKRTSGLIRLVIPTAPGKTGIVEADRSIVVEALR